MCQGGVTCLPVYSCVRVEWHIYPCTVVSGWSDISTSVQLCQGGVTYLPVCCCVRELSLLVLYNTDFISSNVACSRWYSWEIAHLALNKAQSLTLAFWAWYQQALLTQKVMMYFTITWRQSSAISRSSVNFHTLGISKTTGSILSKFGWSSWNIVSNRVRVMVFNATFNNISVISWRKPEYHTTMTAPCVQ